MEHFSARELAQRFRGGFGVAQQVGEGVLIAPAGEECGVGERFFDQVSYLNMVAEG